MNVPITRDVENDLRLVVGTLEDRSLRTYVHGDPCPDNVLPGDGGRVLNFEAGGYGLALLRKS